MTQIRSFARQHRQGPAGQPRHRRRGRRGIASVIAMMYLVLFSALALGFYAASTMSAQIARNDRNAAQAQLSVESGMSFIRYQLGNIDMSATTDPAQVLGTVAAQLGTAMNGTLNMNGDTVQLVNGTIQVPGNTSHFINVDSAGQSRFRVDITASGQFLNVKITGRSSDANVTRAVQMQYQKAQRASAIFNYGVASKGKIVTAGASTIAGASDPAKGSVLSTTSSDPTPVVIGGKSVSGDISISNPSGTVTYSGASVGGTSDSTQIALYHIHKGVTAPDFPTVDSSVYLPYAMNTYKGGKSLSNTVIPPNTNPSFAGNTTITGVLYIKAPNIVSFKGNCTIQGVIVVDSGAALDLAHNQLSFSGNVSATGVESLPASYGNLRSLTGNFILAPNFAVSFGGDFGTVSGSIIASQISFSGNAGGTINGSVIGLYDTPMNISGSSDILIASTGTQNYPAGVSFGTKYTPLYDTYAEVAP